MIIKLCLLIIPNYERITLTYAMTTPINNCQCGQPANQLVIIKGFSYYLCAKHVQTLEKFLGEKLESLTTYYEPRI
jgi:hypothetical protein